jgi:predicted DNA-binding transcriptional regulator YafY
VRRAAWRAATASAPAALPPLLLDEEEAVAVAVGLRTAASVGVAGIEETAVRALAKLEQVLPKRLRRRVNAVGAATVPYPGTGPAVDTETLATIATACRDAERLRFAYRAHDGTSTRRLVEPHRLVHTGRRWYLVAWDTGRADWRTFRVDRIDRPSTDRRFVPREPPAADIAAARSVSSARDRYSDWLGGLAVYIAEIGVDFEVLDPPELVERVTVLAGRFARATE